MEEILSTVKGLVFFIAILGCVPYGIWIIYSLFKKRWKSVALQITIPVAILTGLVGVSALCAPKIFTDYLTGLYDCNVTLGSPIFEYDSARAFNGDGYSLSVYDLPDTIRQRFKAMDQRLLNEYPKRPSERQHWQSEHWREAPFDGKFQDYLDFALAVSTSDPDLKPSTHFNLIRKALGRKGTYYAFFFYMHGNSIGNIDFFIVDLDGGRLYAINHNT